MSSSSSSSGHSRTRRPIQQVLSIPLLVDTICLHLQSCHIAVALLVSKTFYRTFIGHRWETLDCSLNDSRQPGSIFPKNPSRETRSALIRYGAGMARHLVLRTSQRDFFTYACARPTTHIDTLTGLLARYNAKITRLKSLTTHGILHDQVSDDWMHWNIYEDFVEYNTVNFTPPEGEQTDSAQMAMCHANLSIFSLSLALTLMGRNHTTLQRVCLEGFVIKEDDKDSVVFSLRLIDAITKLESLRSLQIGHLSMMDILNLIFNLPSRVQELVLMVWLPAGTSTNLLQMDTDAVEQAWVRYQRNLRKYRREQTETGATTAAVDYSKGSSSSSIQSLLKNMRVKTQITRFSLSYMFGTYPMWILYEILRHCPNLNSFKVPIIPIDKTDELLQVLKEDRPGRIEHLDLSNLSNYGAQVAKLLDHFKPTTTIPVQSHPWSISNPNRPSISATTTTITMAQIHQSLLVNEGLRSIVLRDQGPRTIDTGVRELFFRQLLSLTRISIVGCGFLFGSKQILRLLESCRGLEVLLTMNLAGARDKISRQPLETIPSPTVIWTDFIHGTGHTVNGDPSEKKTSAADISEKLSPTSSPSPSSSSSSSGSSPRLQPGLALGSDWPCALTLRVLSLDLRLFITDFLDRNSQLYIEGIYLRLGQLENLQDLAIGVNWIGVTPTREFKEFCAEKRRRNHIPELDSEKEEETKILVSLTFSLSEGLGHMHRLKRLRRLNIKQTCLGGIGRPELLWMAKHLPSLESIPGLVVLDIENWDKEEYERMRKLCPYVSR